VNELARIDYEDTFSVSCPAGTTATEVLIGFFTRAPGIVKALMTMRNGLVSRLGLKTERPIGGLQASMLQARKRVGFFEIGALTEKSAVMGADDRHLNFRVRLWIENCVLSCTTQVQYNNTAGRVYFFFVKPFHRRIVPMMLKASVRGPAGP
jgi:hypothetical protein